MHASDHAEAEMTFLPTEQGGRSHAALSGYSPVLSYDGEHLIVRLTFPNGQVRPGETTRSSLWLFTPEAHQGRLYPGKAFEILEGSRVVAHGRVTRIFRFA